ncbi:MAG: hypothetical protein GWN32_02375 [Gemmatimonadetes bacterium]|nr:hypothetical protein [Gemmatimonadota bacterium]
MNRRASLALAIVALGAAVTAASVVRTESDSVILATIAAPDTTGPALWAHLQEEHYASSWALWPGKGRLYMGQEPHGMRLTTYVNDIAARALASGAEEMPDGAIVVKENFTPDSALAAITVMYKRNGYNPDHANWFFSKFRPDGEVDQAPNGMRLAGRVPGCQNCHGSKKDNDYIFTSELGG